MTTSPIPPTPDPRGGPQDAPLASAISAAPTAGPTTSQGSRETTYVAAPTGPHWPLVLLGLLLVTVAVGLILHLVGGFPLSSIRQHASLALVGVGGLLAVVGLVGMAARRRTGGGDS